MFGAVLVGVNSLNIWLPQIINGFGHLSLIQVGLLSALPVLLHISTRCRYLERNRRFPFYCNGVGTTEEIKISNTFEILTRSRPW